MPHACSSFSKWAILAHLGRRSSSNIGRSWRTYDQQPLETWLLEQLLSNNEQLWTLAGILRVFAFVPEQLDMCLGGATRNRIASQAVELQVETALNVVETWAWPQRPARSQHQPELGRLGPRLFNTESDLVKFAPACARHPMSAFDSASNGELYAWAPGRASLRSERAGVER